jgi:hypothetical protein
MEGPVQILYESVESRICAWEYPKKRGEKDYKLYPPAELGETIVALWKHKTTKGCKVVETILVEVIYVWKVRRVATKLGSKE